MNSQYLGISVVVFLVITTSICLAVIGPIADDDDDLPSVVKGSNRVLQNAFGEILQRRRRASSSHDQVVKISFSRKENKSIRALSQEEKDYLVHIHNAYRSTVYPYAANMLEVVWDEEIAAFAQDWADQCKGAHRPNRDLSPWINMGENIFWAFGGKYHEGMSAKFWWDEVQWYNFTDKSCIKGKMCGHYVTMVWAASGRMGCGVTRCPRLEALPDIGMGAYYFVCNYNGRFFSYTKPYKEHLSICSFCFKTQAPKCRYNLCVTKEMLDYDIGYNGSTVEIGFNRTKTHSSRKSPITPSPTHSTSNQTSSQLTTRHSTTSPSRTTVVNTTTEALFTTRNTNGGVSTNSPTAATTNNMTSQSTLASSQRSTEVTSNDNTTVTPSVVASTTDTPRVTSPYSTSTAQTNADSTTTTTTTTTSTTTATTSSKGETTTTTANEYSSTTKSAWPTTKPATTSATTQRVTSPYSTSAAQTNADSTTTTTSTISTSTTTATTSSKGETTTTANEYSSTTKSALPTTKPATTKAVIDEFPIKKGESFLMDVVREAVLNTGKKMSPTLIQAAFSLIVSILIRILRVS